MGTAVGDHGVEADSDKTIFPAFNLEVKFSHEKSIKFRLPWIIPGIGSTNISKNNWEGLAQGLKPLMCGSRKFALEHISRDDLASLTREASEISGIQYITDVDKEEVEKILSY